MGKNGLARGTRPRAAAAAAAGHAVAYGAECFLRSAKRHRRTMDAGGRGSFP